MTGQPLIEVWFLEFAEFDAAVDALDGVFEGFADCGYLVVGEELLDIVAGFGGAEAAGGANDVGSRPGG